MYLYEHGTYASPPAGTYVSPRLNFGLSTLSFYGPLQAVLKLIFSFTLIIGLYLLITYIFKSVALYKMAKEKGVKYPLFAWLPIGDKYIVGSLIGDIPFGTSLRIKDAALWLPLLDGVALVTMDFTGVFGNLILYAIGIVNVYALFSLFKEQDAKHPLGYTIASLLLGPGIFLFITQNRKDKERKRENLKSQPESESEIETLKRRAKDLEEENARLSEMLFVTKDDDIYEKLFVTGIDDAAVEDPREEKEITVEEIREIISEMEETETQNEEVEKPLISDDYPDGRVGKTE